jgi:hypothetical protein
MQQHLADSPGILLAGLSEPQAQRAAEALTRSGLSVMVLPDQEVVTPPPLVEVREAKVLPEGLRVEVPRPPVLVPWEEVVFLDAAQVRTVKKVTGLDSVPRLAADGFADDGEDSGPPYLMARTRMQVSWQDLLDVVSYEPWLHLQIDRERFRFGRSGLPLHPTSAKNFLALVIAVKTRATKAAEGPGVGLLFDGKPDTRQQFQSMKAFENVLQWQLTRVFRPPQDPE